MRWLVGLYLCFMATIRGEAAYARFHTLERIEEKLLLYLTLAQDQRDGDGFIEWKNCDSLLFSGLVGAFDAPGDLVIEAARDENGAWHRRSLGHQECYPHLSKSTVSRDMFVGLLWFVWKQKR